MPILNLSDAIDLYYLLESYLPEIKDDKTTVIDYVWDMLQNMKESPVTYIRVLSLLTGMEEKTILELDGYDLYNIFVERLMQNRFGQLQVFMKRHVDNG